MKKLIIAGLVSLSTSLSVVAQEYNPLAFEVALQNFSDLLVARDVCDFTPTREQVADALLDMLNKASDNETWGNLKFYVEITSIYTLEHLDTPGYYTTEGFCHAVSEKLNSTD